MAPRDANHQFPDYNLTIEYDAGGVPFHDVGPAPVDNDVDDPVPEAMDVEPPVLPFANDNTATNANAPPQAPNLTTNIPQAQPPIEVLLNQAPAINAAPSNGSHHISHTNSNMSQGNLMSVGSEYHQDVDPLAIDISESDDQDAQLVDAAIASASENIHVSPASPPDAHGNSRRRRIARLDRHNSVIDLNASNSDSEDELEDVPAMEATMDISTDESNMSSPPGTPYQGSSMTPQSTSTLGSTQAASSQPSARFSFRRRFLSLHPQENIINDSDNNSSGSSFNGPNSAPLTSNFQQGLPEPPSAPHRFISNSSVTSNGSQSLSIPWNQAFDSTNFDSDNSSVLNSTASLDHTMQEEETSRHHYNLSFGPNTTMSDLKYFAERGCVVPLLRALNTVKLIALGTRMLADYAKMPRRRVAVASNKKILEFCCKTMLSLPTMDNMGTDWPAREYAVETIRSLTATEDSDSYLMGCNGLLKALSIVARGGPFASYEDIASGKCQVTPQMGLVSGKARLHACIAIMNLSCGKANKVKIASIAEVLEAMREVMVSTPENFSPATSPSITGSTSSSATPKSVATEARLKAATCVKNLSNADKNDEVLLEADGLIAALAFVAAETCGGEKGATNCTTNACLALMNLSISKVNKHRVFSTEGVMDALMKVLEETSPEHHYRGSSWKEARIKACSALSNLAIGYENKIPMFNYPGFVASILKVIESDSGEARTKACSILWSFAAEMKNQVPVVQRGDILPVLVRVAEEDSSTEARFKCVAALTLLAESSENAMPLLEEGALHPLMDILHDAGADPTQWKGQTASWCVGFLMNMAQSDEAAPYLQEAGVVELLAPLLTLDHYQSLKAAIAVAFVCRYDEGHETYDLLRKTENVIPKIINLLHNTLAGEGGNGYKYGVFTLRSSVGCISSLAAGPEFMKERISTKDVFDSLLRVVNDFCVDGGNNGAIVGGGRDDTQSATYAIRALQALTEYLIPIPGSSSLPFGSPMDSALMTALDSFASCTHPDLAEATLDLAKDAYQRIQSSLELGSLQEDSDSGSEGYGRRRSHPHQFFHENSIVAALVQGCCIGPNNYGGIDGGFFPSMIRTTNSDVVIDSNDDNLSQSSSDSQGMIRTFLLTDSRSGRRFAVPTDPSGGRAFNDGRLWCYRRGRFCKPGEVPDPDYEWNDDLQAAYTAALNLQEQSGSNGQERRNSSQRGAVF